MPGRADYALLLYSSMWSHAWKGQFTGTNTVWQFIVLLEEDGFDIEDIEAENLKKGRIH